MGNHFRKPSDEQAAPQAMASDAQYASDPLASTGGEDLFAQAPAPVNAQTASDPFAYNPSLDQMNAMQVPDPMDSPAPAAAPTPPAVPGRRFCAAPPGPTPKRGGRADRPGT